MRRIAAVCVLSLIALALAIASREPQVDTRLRHASRRVEKNGWIWVHLEGTPAEIGYQHGYLLAPEIGDTLHTVSFEMVHEEHHDWQFFRDKAQTMLWPHVDAEYRAELQGIADGAVAHGEKLDVWDIVALNAWLEMPYFDKWDARRHGLLSSSAPAEHCSAFVATGSYTKDGRVLIAHNNWTSYETGERWNIIFDIVPAQGNHILMDGMAGLIHSGDDFGMNSAGILITETTISRFNGFDPDGVPEFVRARKAMQYSASIDDFARIMKEGNNGGYANDWLIADRKTNEIARLELGLKNVTLERTRDGFFVGSNFPVNEKLAREETDFDSHDAGDSANARHARWLQLMEQNKGKIDVAAAQRFLGDHFDTYEKKVDPDERTLCGHIDRSPRGDLPWAPPYAPVGAVQAKVTDAAMAGSMSMRASLGHSCGIGFKAASHLRKHTEFAWQQPVLRDMPSRGWTTFSAQ
ncbi:MAG TPA: C45 family peptidase [Bryobacteraceae bacterium]|nr:C45 family peptidase [Bryobacteraceae bacterium]